jgi:two-component system chemotaxis response regulator CheY
MTAEPLKRLRVFLVDDEPHVRLYLRTILKGCPVEVVAEGASGREAVTGYDQMKPDVLLMDISMPYMTGMEALGEILEMDPDAKIILLTSITDQRSIRDALSRGATHYIRKDTPVEDILAALQNCFDDILKGQGD